MIRRLLPVFFVLSLLAGPVRATNITVQTGAGEDHVRVLRGLAEAMLRERAGGGSPGGEGEELVIRPGGSTGGGEPAGDRGWQDALARLGAAVQLNDLPSVIQEMRQSQGETFAAVQDTFKALNSAARVGIEEQHSFLKDIERQLSMLLADQVILSGLRLKIETALAAPGITPAARVELSGCLKQLGDSQTAMQGLQNEAAKMANVKFRTDSSPGSVRAAEQLAEETRKEAEPVDALLGELLAHPADLSQGFLEAGSKKMVHVLSSLNNLLLEAQGLVEDDPTNLAALAVLKQLNVRILQVTKTLRDIVVVKVPPGTLIELNQNSEMISIRLASLKESLAAIKTRKGVTQADVDRIFQEYDDLTRLYDESRMLGEAVTRGMSGQKYQTAEQTELLKLLAGITETAGQLGSEEDSLRKGTRDALWAAFLKERQDAAARAAAQLALINDVTAGTLQAPIVARYLPVAPPAAHSDVSAALSGKVLGDVIVKDGITYGVTVKILGPTTLSGPSDTASIKQAQLEVFRIENGQYTGTTIETIDIYSGVPHAALGLGVNNALLVFLNDTQGEKVMVGELYTLNRDTLLALAPSSQFSFGRSQGWYPYIDENGQVANIYVDGGGNAYVCSDASCSGTPSSALDFKLGTDALKAVHSNFTFNTAATPEELPTDVVAKRLTGETGVTALGNYDYMSWGKWNDGAGVADTIYTNSSWIAGSLTPAADIPVTGSASYSGQVAGKLSEGGAISNIGGTTALTANFSGRQLTGTFDMTKNNAAWKSASVNASWGAGTGNIAGALNTTDAAMSGAVNGTFFGPAANSVGGAWNLSNTAGTDKAAGVFTGDKQ